MRLFRYFFSDASFQIPLFSDAFHYCIHIRSSILFYNSVLPFHFTILFFNSFPEFCSGILFRNFILQFCSSILFRNSILQLIEYTSYCNSDCFSYIVMRNQIRRLLRRQGPVMIEGVFFLCKTHALKKLILRANNANVWRPILPLQGLFL